MIRRHTLPVAVVFILLLVTSVQSFQIVHPCCCGSTAQRHHLPLWAAPSSNAVTADTKQIPVHLLSGFLGSGKTTLLKHVLENVEGAKVGVVVNDVASVNIDAKLVSASSSSAKDGTGIVQLENGCACCSAQDELLASIDTLLKGSKGSANFDAIVVELSGVADPVAVRNNWKAAAKQGDASTIKCRLSNVVTVIDACTFGSDYMTFDSAGDREQWELDKGDCTSNRKVVELLAEQVEEANLLIINKADLAGEEQVAVASSMAASLNTKAATVTTSWGKVSAQQILKDYKKTEKLEDDCSDSDCTDASHSHSHSHDHAAAAACTEPDCTDSSHSHSHDDHVAECTEPDCTDTSHSHSHNDHAAAACTEPDCTDSSHSHAHNDHAAGCTDADCTDTSHSHSHSHASSSSNAIDNLGISSFVYRSTRPFDADRLMQILYKWPIPIKDELDFTLLKNVATEGYSVDGTTKGDSPFVGVLRSKGFCWFSPTAWDGLLEDSWRHNTAMYWSHAGKHMGIQEAGRFWGSVEDAVMRDFFFDNPAEYERIQTEDFVSEEFGDRRQEIVFIGVDLKEKEIREALDACLLTDEELDGYRERVRVVNEATMQSQG